jgi:Chitobiase/beta-hexosaminidase C-terminal domain
MDLNAVWKSAGGLLPGISMGRLIMEVMVVYGVCSRQCKATVAIQRSIDTPMARQLFAFEPKLFRQEAWWRARASQYLTIILWAWYGGNMRNFCGARHFCLTALVIGGVLTPGLASVAAGQAVQQSEATAGTPAPILPSTPPPFEMRVSGGEETFLPNSAWHCPEYPINHVPPQFPLDIPDAPAIFFRDARGTIHMFASGAFNYAFVGNTLNDLQQDCHSVYVSHFDPDPWHYEYKEWIRAAYTLDGTHVYGVAHNEYYCDGEGPRCDYRALTAIFSDDGGYHFSNEPMPQRLIATIPYPKLSKIPRGHASGLAGNSDIIRNPNDGYYYMSAFDLSAAQQCMLRSRDLNTWVAWNGTSFSMQLNDPRAYDNPPQTYHCVGGHGLESLRYLSQYNLFIGLFWANGDILYEVSSDLVHWSAAKSVMLPVTFGRPRNGRPGYLYPSLLDPDSTSVEFQVFNSGDPLYLLLVKDIVAFDSYGRPIEDGRNWDIVRFPLSFTPAENDENAVSAAPVTFSPAAGKYVAARTVTLSCKTPSSMIYYTTNGQPPAMDTFFTKQYTGPLAVAQSEKITALCLSTGYRPSPVRAAQYTIGGGQ